MKKLLIISLLIVGLFANKDQSESMWLVSALKYDCTRHYDNEWNQECYGSTEVGILGLFNLKIGNKIFTRIGLIGGLSNKTSTIIKIPTLGFEMKIN